MGKARDFNIDWIKTDFIRLQTKTRSIAKKRYILAAT